MTEYEPIPCHFSRLGIKKILLWNYNNFKNSSKERPACSSILFKVPCAISECIGMIFSENLALIRHGFGNIPSVFFLYDNSNFYTHRNTSL